MAILRYFVQEVQCYDPLRNSIPTTIFEYPVDVDLVGQDGSRRRRICLYNLDITVVPLSRLGDIDGSSIRARDATLWLLNETAIRDKPNVRPASTYQCTLGVVGAHPLLRPWRHGNHGRIEAIGVPMQMAIVARDDGPARLVVRDINGGRSPGPLSSGKIRGQARRKRGCTTAEAE